MRHVARPPGGLRRRGRGLPPAARRRRQRPARCRAPATGTGGPVNIASRVVPDRPRRLRAGHPRDPRRRPRELPLVERAARADDQGPARPGAPLPRSAAGSEPGDARGQAGRADDAGRRRPATAAAERRPRAERGARGGRATTARGRAPRAARARAAIPRRRGLGRRSVRTDGVGEPRQRERRRCALSATSVACSPTASATGPASASPIGISPTRHGEVVGAHARDAPRRAPAPGPTSPRA